MIGHAFDWLVNEGWSDFSERVGLNMDSAHEFRQRHLVRAIKERGF